MRCIEYGRAKMRIKEYVAKIAHFPLPNSSSDPPNNGAILAVAQIIKA